MFRVDRAFRRDAVQGGALLRRDHGRRARWRSTPKQPQLRTGSSSRRAGRLRGRVLLPARFRRVLDAALLRLTHERLRYPRVDLQERGHRRGQGSSHRRLSLSTRRHDERRALAYRFGVEARSRTALDAPSRTPRRQQPGATPPLHLVAPRPNAEEFPDRWRPYVRC